MNYVNECICECDSFWIEIYLCGRASEMKYGRKAHENHPEHQWMWRYFNVIHAIWRYDNLECPSPSTPFTVYSMLTFQYFIVSQRLLNSTVNQAKTATHFTVSTIDSRNRVPESSPNLFSITESTHEIVSSHMMEWRGFQNQHKVLRKFPKRFLIIFA